VSRRRYQSCHVPFRSGTEDEARAEDVHCVQPTFLPRYASRKLGERLIVVEQAAESIWGRSVVANHVNAPSAWSPQGTRTFTDVVRAAEV
jgi:hypothetical protein